MKARFPLWGMFYVLGSTAWAKEPVRLFQARAVPVPGYEHILAQLKAGDVVEFSDGMRVPVRRVVETQDLGKSTFFFATDGGTLVRLPRAKGVKIEIDHGVKITYRSLHEDWLRLAPVLARAGVPIPEIDFARSLPGERAFVKELLVLGTMDDLVRNGRVLHPVVRENYVDAARTFFESTWRIQKIADLSLDQIALTPAGAVLLDWGHFVTLADSLDSGMVFRQSEEYMRMRALQIGDRMVELFSVVPAIGQIDPRNSYFEDAIALEIRRRRVEAGFPKRSPWKTDPCWRPLEP